MAAKRSVLFICSGNIARSQMAEALLRDRAGNRFEVRSAGSRPGRAVRPLVVEALRELGIDISGASPKGFAAVAGARFDYVITLCDNARGECPIFPGHPVAEHWSVEDPVDLAGTEAEQLDGIRRIRDDISRRIGEFVARAG